MIAPAKNVTMHGHSRDAERMGRNRASARDLVIPDVCDKRRKEACEADDALWLKTYCEDVFYNPFTRHQLKIIADCGEALRYGTEKCKAAPRGDGKSSIIKYLALKYALCRQVRFPLIIAATSSKGKKTLNSLKRRLASKADTPLSQDYPLECYVARYVDPWPSRARNVTANGQRAIHVEWGPDIVILPTWEDVEPLGPILMSLGVTSDDLQGCNIYDQRPDFVMLDDLDSRDSLAAEDGVVAEKIEEAIDKTVAGLGGQSRRLGKFMICTITSRDAAAYKYSDPKQKPSWSGERIAAITAWPKRTDLWERYVELRQSGQNLLDKDGNPKDVFGREAHRFYLDHRAEMDEGSEVANPYNYIRDVLPDGTPVHASALQRCYDYIADKGMESFLTEHQNDPPAKTDIVESGLTANRIQRQVSGMKRGEVPPRCMILTQGIDVGKRYLTWVVRAWGQDGTGFTIDYGTTAVHGTTRGTDEGVDVSVMQAIRHRMDQLKEDPYFRADGEIVPVSMTLIDSGYRTEAVYRVCNELGLGVFPAKGIGQSAGCVRGVFRTTKSRTNTVTPGDGWNKVRVRRGVFLIEMDTDRWKAWEHDRWLTDPHKSGAMFLFGDHEDAYGRMSRDQYDHKTYAKQVVAEIEVEEMVKGVLKRYWKARGDNHFLDASYMSDVAANMKGIRLSLGAAENAEPRARPTARELAQRTKTAR